MRSYYFKNFMSVALLVMISFLVLGIIFIGVGRNIMLNERKDTIAANALELSRAASAHEQDGSVEDLEFRIMLTSMAESTGNHCFLTDENGVVISCSDRDLNCSHLGRSIPEDVLAPLRTAGSYTGRSSLNGFYSAPRFLAALPVFSAAGGIAGYAFVSSDAAAIIGAWAALLMTFLIAAGAVLLLLLITAFVNAKRMARPVNEMADAALRFAHGDFSARVTYSERDDEIGALASAFNQMADSLEKSESRRSEFIANVAHELKTPMTTISGFADGILDGTIPPSQQNRYLETISSETKRLNRLVRNTLDMSRIQSVSREELLQKRFDAAELLAETLLLFEPKITAKDLAVDALIPEDGMTVRGDADSINQVMYNLIENAVKFSKPGGTLGVSLFRRSDKAYVSVKNEGETIPEAELALIFDRFHKTDKSRSLDRDGYGLGLYIVKTILNNHGEDIAVTSRDGVTEFVFSLTPVN